MNIQKQSQELYEDNHHMNTMPTGMLKGVEDQDLINAKIQYYGVMHAKKIPKNWNQEKS